MKKQFITACVLALAAGFAQAHFQVLYTPEVQLENNAKVPLKMIFWHPMENGHAMDMGKPQQAFYVFKGEKKDLLPTLKTFQFQGKENQSLAYETEVDIRRNGDYTFVLIPEPYFEKSEDTYIQQITKSYLNKGGIPTDWHKPIGLPAEIIPFNKPTNVVVGSTFTGQVLSGGKPASGVEIEIEYMAAPPDVKSNRASTHKAVSTKGGALVAVSDERGMFTFGIPKAGFWGFAALGAGIQKEYKGKELSQDAVIWIRADELQSE